MIAESEDIWRLYLTLRDNGLTFPQLCILNAIESGNDTLKALATALNVSSASSSTSTDHLKKLGLIRKTKTWGKPKRLALTDAGKQKLKAVIELV